MTGPTHKQCAITLAFITAVAVYELGLSDVNYYIALIILLMTAKAGAKFPDVDHHWQYVKDKTVPNWIANKLIHLTGGKHRSWQTHSIDILVILTLIFMLAPSKLLEAGFINQVDKSLIHIILLGFLSGWWSHLLADMLNSVGVRLFCFGKIKVKFVPKNIGKLRFNTGNEWEAFVYKVSKSINLVLGFIATIYPIIRTVDFQSLYNQIIILIERV